MSTADAIVRVTDGIRETLLEKNRTYGDSALNPVRIFSKADALEQLNVRLDDKLSRVMRGTEYPGDDTILDLVGYLVLLLVAREGAPESAPVGTCWRDCSGDVWEVLEDDSLRLHPYDTDRSYVSTYSLSDIRARWGPLTPVTQ